MSREWMYTGQLYVCCSTDMLPIWSGSWWVSKILEREWICRLDSSFIMPRLAVGEPVSISVWPPDVASKYAAEPFVDTRRRIFLDNCIFSSGAVDGFGL